MYNVINLPPHPTSPSIPRIIQSLCGVGEELGAGVLQVEELAVGGVGAAGCEGAALVGGDIDAFGGAGEHFAAVAQEVAEGAVGGVGASRHP